jgi:hypothetical protein
MSHIVPSPRIGQEVHATNGWQYRSIPACSGRAYSLNYQGIDSILWMAILPAKRRVSFYAACSPISRVVYAPSG